LALIAAAHAETHVQSAIYPLVYPYAMISLGFGYPELGAIVGAATLVSGLLQGIHGWLSRWVRRKALVGGGNIFLGLSLMLSGISNGLGIFTAGRVASGVAASPQHPMAASLISDWYPSKRRATALSLHFSGGNVGTVLTPLVGAFLIALVGWQRTLILFGIPGLIIGALVWRYLKDDRPPMAAGRPEENRKPSYFGAFKNRNVVKLISARAMTAAGRGLGVITVYVPLYLAQSLHYGVIEVGFFFTVLAAGSVFSPVIGGTVADRWVGRKRVIIVSLLFSSLATVGLVMARASPLLVGVALFGLGLAVFNEGPLSQALLSDSTTKENRDGAFSMYFVVSYVGGAFWGFLIAYIIGIYGFVPAFELIAATYIPPAVVYSTVKEVREL
jgi:MFS family permease